MFIIYNDAGVSEASVNALITLLSDFGVVKCVSGSDIQDQRVFDTVTWFVMPGGRSLPFYKTCGRVGNKAIIDFVKRGGNYLGLCAGAYYAAKETVFAEGLPLALHLSGALNFFPGRAVGPVFLPNEFAYQSEAGAASVAITMKNTEKYAVYCNGGCYFDNAEHFSNTEIIARYGANHKTAVIACDVGRGRVILSGVHPELSDHEDTRKRFLRALLMKNR